MKKVITFLLLTTPLVNGCNKTAPVEISSASKATDKGLELQQKIACKQFEAKAEEDAQKDPTGLEIIDSVFYSPKANSCLVAKHLLWYPKYAGGRDPEDLEIDDILGGKQIFYQHFDHAQDAATISVLMDKQIAELK